MADISMCLNDKCKFKKECYRFTAKPSEFLQAYGEFNCKDKEGKETYFWNNKQAQNKLKKIKTNFGKWES